MSVAISAIGAVTPLGKTWAETLAQYRQGKKRLLRDKSVIGPDGLPTRLAPVYAFHAQKDAPRRLAQLTLAALHDLLEQRPEAASAEICFPCPAGSDKAAAKQQSSNGWPANCPLSLSPSAYAIPMK